MIYDNIKKELNYFYTQELPKLAKGVRDRVFEKMDRYDAEHPSQTSYQLKAKLYQTIADEIVPQVFEDIPFFYETGALLAYSDGKYCRGGMDHANGWLYMRNEHLFRDLDPHAYDVYYQDRKNRLYAQTGSFVDIMHIGIPMKKIFRVGLKGIYEECVQTLESCQSDEERDFIRCAIAGLQALRTMELKFADAAKEKNMTELADLAARVPWEAPQTFHEGLCTLAFIRKSLGALEGVGFNSFGRVDMLLAPLYEKDIARGVDEAQMLDEVTRFLLVWDCTFDKRDLVRRGSEYELENTLTLGWHDIEGNAVFNGVTKLFLDARDAHNILYPKMMLRYSQHSPKEYLDRIGQPLLQSKGFSLYANDDTVIPSLLETGIDETDAVDYVVGGCWDPLTPDTAVKFSGEYLNLIYPLDLAIQEGDRIASSELQFESFEDNDSFEQIYQKYINSIRTVLMRKAGPMSVAGRIWHKVNPAPTLSALMEPCIPNRKDMTNGGTKYNRESVYFCGFAEAVDSLLAIKSLCFDKKVCTVAELLNECRNNWDNEVLRQMAISAPSFGDGSEESSAFVGRVYDDLYRISRNLPTAYGGEFRIGFNLYTEVIFWGEPVKATPNGRRNGDYISSGLTPSRLLNDVSIFDMLDSFRYIDMKKCAGNSSVTITLPAGKISTEQMTSIFRAIAASGIQSLQPNCVDKDMLLAAQKDPENYKHIIVRVCGFSAPFVLLSPVFQEEFLSRVTAGV